jgi:hypothetical protein
MPLTENGRILDMAYTIEENEWMNQVGLQLRAKDIR